MAAGTVTLERKVNGGGAKQTLEGEFDALLAASLPDTKPEVLRTVDGGREHWEALYGASPRTTAGASARGTEVVPVSYRARVEILRGEGPATAKGGAVDRALKRVFDVAFSLTALTMCAPILLAIGVAVKLDSRGGVLFGHLRVGRSGRMFKMWKFRTMVCKADSVLAEYLMNHPEQRESWEKYQKLRVDPRVTIVGRFLRKTSLDELPQLWNVLRGDMSIVGPRPIVTQEIHRYGSRYQYYTSVLPGITGLWQVSGRNNTTYHQRVEHDATYARTRSLTLDLRILLSTISVVFRCEGAY